MLKINHKTILGLDISITGTGICIVTNDPSLGGEVIKNSRYKLLYSAVIKGKTKGTETTYQELVWTPEKGIVKNRDLGSAEGIMRGFFVADNVVRPLLSKFPITHVCYEGYSLHGNGRVFDIAEFTLPIKNIIHTTFEKSKCTEVKPTQLKKFFTGNGTASKEGQLYIAEKVYGLNFGDDNLADAFALSMYSAHFSR